MMLVGSCARSCNPLKATSHWKVFKSVRHLNLILKLITSSPEN